MEDLLNQIGLPLIAVVVPIIMIGVKWVLPRLPTASIPLIAGVLGPALDWALAALASIDPSDPTVAALVGLAGVGLREVVDQIRKAMAKHEGRLSAHPLATAAAVALLALSAGGCTSMLPQMSPIMGAAPGADSEALGDDSAAPETSLLDQMADDIVKAGTPEQRALRVCLFSTVAAEVYAYRLLNYGGEPGELEAAYGTVARMAQAVKTLREQHATLWFETEMFYAAAGIVRAVEGPLRDRALGAVGRVLTANWRGIARGLRTGAAQAALAGAMLRDARNAAAAIGAGSVTMDQAWDACQGRLDAKLGQLAGAIGVTPPPLLRLGS